MSERVYASVIIRTADAGASQVAGPRVDVEHEVERARAALEAIGWRMVSIDSSAEEGTTMTDATPLRIVS